jgi:hypothetical protein
MRNKISGPADKPGLRNRSANTHLMLTDPQSVRDLLRAFKEFGAYKFRYSKIISHMEFDPVF